MKKAIKIGGVVMGIILIAALIIFIFFPGIFTYKKVKKEYPHIDRTIGTFSGFDVKLPKDFVAYTKDGVTVMGPKDARYSSDMIPFKSDGLIVMVTVMEDEPYGDAFFDEYSKYLMKDYQHFFKKLDIEPPQTSYENVKTLRNLTSKDCLKLRGKDKKVFLEYAEYKEFGEKLESLSYYEKDGIKGFFSERSSEGSSKMKYRYALWLFHNEKQYIVSAYSDDKETAMQILSTVSINDD